jgi:hypothetical protein
LKPAEFDLIGRKISEEVDPWQQRSGVAFAFYRLSELIPQHLTVEFIKKIVPRGLNDRTEKCRTLMRDAARLCINKALRIEIN